jgi:rubredoxin
MTKKKLAAAICRHRGIQRQVRWDEYETSDWATIREYLRCPDCGEHQHDFGEEEVWDMIAVVGSLDEFDRIVAAAFADREPPSLFQPPSTDERAAIEAKPKLGLMRSPSRSVH